MPITPQPWKYGNRPDGSRWLSLGDPVKGPHYQGDLVCSDDDAELIISAPQLRKEISQLKLEVSGLEALLHTYQDQEQLESEHRNEAEELPLEHFCRIWSYRWKHTCKECRKTLRLTRKEYCSKACYQRFLDSVPF